MKMHYSWLSTFFLSLIIILFLILQTIAIAETNVTIGTGGINGVYYPTGVNICRMVNDKPDYDIV
jgi:uncharacterized protein